MNSMKTIAASHGGFTHSNTDCANTLWRDNVHHSSTPRIDDKSKRQRSTAPERRRKVELLQAVAKDNAKSLQQKLGIMEGNRMNEPALWGAILSLNLGQKANNDKMEHEWDSDLESVSDSENVRETGSEKNANQDRALNFLHSLVNCNLGVPEKRPGVSRK